MARVPIEPKPWWRGELQGSWLFESRSDGKILYYPQGWGRGYVVPGEDKRREIEVFLASWLANFRKVVRVIRWFGLGFVLPLLALSIFILALPELHGLVSYVSPEIFVAVPLILTLVCGIIAVSPLVLRFLAETAKADLEVSQIRRPFSESLREYATRTDARRLWMEAASSALLLFYALWIMWPRQTSVMVPARVNPRSLSLGVGLIIVGVPYGLIKFWQIRIKSQLGPARS